MTYSKPRAIAAIQESCLKQVASGSQLTRDEFRIHTISNIGGELLQPFYRNVPMETHFSFLLSIYHQTRLLTPKHPLTYLKTD